MRLFLPSTELAYSCVAVCRREVTSGWSHIQHVVVQIRCGAVRSFIRSVDGIERQGKRFGLPFRGTGLASGGQVVA